MNKLKLNDSFESFEAVKNVVQQFNDENLVSFYIRDLKTLQSVAKTKPLREKNAIGMKRIQTLKSPQLSVNKRLFQRQQLMLECFLQKDKIKQIMYNNELITETYISDLLPDKINCMLFENRVQINEIQQFFTAKAFKQFQELLKIRKTIKNYFCTICSNEIIDDIHDSICCDGCLKWLHFKCTAAKKRTNKKIFLY